MKARFLATTGVVFVLVSILFFGPTAANAAEFTADVNQTANGKSIPGKLYVKDNQMRLETMGTVTIVDTDKEKAGSLCLLSTPIWKWAALARWDGEPWTKSGLPKSANGNMWEKKP